MDRTTSATMFIESTAPAAQAPEFSSLLTQIAGRAPTLNVSTNTSLRTAGGLTEFVSAPGLAVPGAMNQAASVGDAIANSAEAQQRFGEIREERAAEAAATEAARLEAIVNEFLDSVRFYVEAEKNAAERYQYFQAKSDAAAVAAKTATTATSVLTLGLSSGVDEDSLVIQEALIPRRFAEAGSNADLVGAFRAWLDGLIARGSTTARFCREYLGAHDDADTRRADVASLDAGRGAPNYLGDDTARQADLQRAWNIWRLTHPAQNATTTKPAGGGGTLVLLLVLAKALALF